MAGESEKFEFDVESGKLKRGIEDIHARLKALYAEMAKQAKQSGQWSEKQYAQYGLMGQEANRLKQQLAQQNDQYKQLLSTQAKGIAQNRMYAQSTRDLNVIFLSLGYAIDDFLTVWSMRSNSIEGILAGAGAAANNFSVILAQILPGQKKLLAFLPALAVAVAKVGYSFYKTGEDADEWNKKIKESADHVRNLQEEMAAMNLGQDLAGVEKKKQEDLEQKEVLKKQLRQVMKEKREAEFDLLNDQKRREIMHGRIPIKQIEGEKRELERRFAPKIEDLEANIRFIDAAIKRRDEQFQIRKDRKEIEGLIRGTGAEDAIVAVIQKMLLDGRNAKGITKELQSTKGFERLQGPAGEQMIQEMIKEAQGKRFQNKFRDLAQQKGPEEAALDRLKLQEEDLRNKIDMGKKGAPGEFRERKAVIREMEQNLQKLQTEITAQERKAEAEEKLTKDGYFLGDKLDEISMLLRRFVKTSQEAGIPLANPLP